MKLDWTELNCILLYSFPLEFIVLHLLYHATLQKHRFALNLMGLSAFICFFYKSEVIK